MFRIVRGAIAWFSERLGGRPFVDCLICSFMALLRFMGYYVTEGDQKTIRANMPGPPTGGTTVAQNFAALAKLGVKILPSFGGVDTSFILANLKLAGAPKHGKMEFVVILRNQDLPIDCPTRKITGIHYDGLHAVTLAAKTADGTQVYVLNPMGRDAAHPPAGAGPDWHPYQGNWEAATNIWNAATKSPAGRVKAAYGTFNQAHGGTP